MGKRENAEKMGEDPAKSCFNRIVAGWGLRADASTFILQQQAERELQLKE